MGIFLDPITGRSQRIWLVLTGAKATDAAFQGVDTEQATERIGANHIALLRQVEYDQTVGRVALIENIVWKVGKEYAGVRTRPLAIPSELAVLLAGLSSAAEVQARLAAAVHEAPADITADRV